jgi:vancomycin permeability regulator SanA
VFGRKLRAGAPDRDYRQRLDRAADLFRRDPSLRLLLLGGATTSGGMSEAQAGLNYLLTLGLPRSLAPRLEQSSRHTLENLRHARDLLRGAPPAPLILLSSRYHLARCARIAEGLGMTHGLCAAEDRMSFDAATLARCAVEALFLLWYQTGRAWARASGNRAMLGRIG